MKVKTILWVFEGNTSVALVEPERELPTNARGVDRRPTNKESEKLRVANVARKIPRIKRENDCTNR